MSGEKLTEKEQEKAKILNAAIAGKITNNQAAKQLQLSVRQVQRAKAAIRKEGIEAVVHRLKGKPSNHSYTQEKKETVITTIKEKYEDFKPSFATEKLGENHNIHISRETTRLWMIEKGLWKSRKQKKTSYRSWRPRKEYYGELEQFDGSYHNWLETRYCDPQGNPLEMCLLASIDDATGKITKATFSANEGVVAVFTFWKTYVTKIGKPTHIYLDKFSTYKINHKAAVDNHELMTQFERAMKTLSIHLIPAHSPQAKGRIERLFKTLQDRLVKELRLANITTPEAANRFLHEVFIAKYNSKFGVIPPKEGNNHNPLQKKEKANLHHIFSIHEARQVKNDFTIQFKNTWYQLREIQPTTVRPRMSVLMETWLDGSVHIMLNDHELVYLVLPEKPKKQIKQPSILTSHPLIYKPPLDHPWRQYHKTTPNPKLNGG